MPNSLQGLMDFVGRQVALANANRILSEQPGYAEHAANVLARREAAARHSDGYSTVTASELNDAPNVDVAAFLSRLPISNQAPPSRTRNVPSGTLGAISQRLAGLGTPMGAMPVANAPRDGAPSFTAGPSSQQGLDIASAMLQQRMGGGSPLGGQDMSLMYRRDPRAAAALIQAQLAAQEAAADRAQRGDIAGQELGFRRESLGANMQSAEAERAAEMNRMLAQIGAQTGMAKERMSFEERLNEADKIARATEAAKQREFLGAQQQGQQTFQGGLADKQMQHQTGLAAMQAALQAASQQAEQAGLDARARMDMQGRIVGAFAEAAASQDPMAWQTVQSRIPEIMRGIAPQVSGDTKPLPKTAAARLMAAEPELTTAWTALMGGQNNAPRKSAKEFLELIPEIDRKNNAAALREFMAVHYPDAIKEQSYFSPWSSSAASSDDVREILGTKKQGNFWSDIRAANPAGVFLDPLAGTPADRVDAAARLLSKFNPL